MSRHQHPDNNGLTGLELVILILVLAGSVAVLLMHISSGEYSSRGRSFPGGFIADSVYVSGDNLQPVGNVYGFPSISRISGTTRVVITYEDSGRLGVVRLVVSLFMGDTGAIDMERVQVQWNNETSQEIIARTVSSTLVCPNWTISNKFNLLPGRTADSDDWLEPGEQFEITLCPREGVLPYGMFTLVVIPDGVAMPLKVSRTVPFRIQPVMNLG
jgi:hypothetical protein